MIAPAAWPPTTSALAGAVILDPRRFGLRLTSTAPRLSPSAILRPGLRLTPLGRLIGLCVLRGPRRRVHGHTTHRGQNDSAVLLCNLYRAGDTPPIPPVGRVLTAPARLRQQQWQRPLLLAPRLHLLTDRTGPGHQGDEPSLMCSPYPQGALARGFAIGDDPFDSIQPQREPGRNGVTPVDASTRMAVTERHAQWHAPIATDAKTQEDLFEVGPSILALARSRTGRLGACCGCLLGAIQGKRRRLLMQPRC
jgi:hypothetical protein